MADSRAKPSWYLPLLLGVDAGVTSFTVLMVFGTAGHPHPIRSALAAALIWVGVLAVRRRYHWDSIGESRGALPVLHDWLIFVAVLAVLAAATAQTPAPLTSLAALAPTLVGALLSRRFVHGHLTAVRRDARAVSRVLVVGEPSAMDSAVQRLASRTDHPFAVVGALVTEDGAPADGLVRERLHLDREGTAAREVVDAAGRLRADLVLLTPGGQLSGDRLRELCWALHDTGLDVALAPGLVETSVKRLEASTVAGLTVLRVNPPRGGGVQGALKTLTDRCGAALGLLLLAPLFALLILAIRLDSPGPAFFRQERVGRDQESFRIWKFRTMVPDAEQRKNTLAASNEHDGLMFKMRRDPRVTRVGRLLRRTSLDELPQLFNVLRGDMSLVGPRPPLPDEVAGYDATAVRRLRVKPGMTGLWQVSGRSDLSWDETVQLDLHYVDNWSFSSDLDVLSRTFRAVVDGSGAY
ncbi:sugar transferase [Streptomyces sp. JJ66]|uniref:sugar transferase n=1 Tax=Streptomyces sp. JJ66 TaxID=2803843 RepID=UPI0027E2CBF8|nr:sugar transferase [Streptomyces sp. JJ66]